MKKLLRIPLLLAAMFLTSIPLSAQDFEVDGILYNITNATTKTVEVIGCGRSGEVSIPNSVTYSETSYSVTSINYCGCDSLTSLSIPNSVILTDWGAFRCPALKSLYFEDGNTEIEIRYYSYYVNHSDNTWIFTSAFKYSPKLETVYIGRNINHDNTISPFNDNEELTSVSIGPSVSAIPSDLFRSCSGLSKIDVDTQNNYYSSVNGILFDKNGTTLLQYPSGRTDSEYHIPNTVTSIGNNAFYGCTGLTSVTIPNSVTSIGNNAFSGCTGLTSVTIPNSVTSIGNNAFSGCTGLTEVHISSIESWLKIEMANAIFSGYKLILNGTEVTNLTIPTSISQIKSYAFSGCTGLTSIDIPNSVTTIGNNAFSGCTGLTSVTIGNSVTEIGEGAFYGCTGLTSITIPSSVTSIASNAFFGNQSLKKVIFEDSPNELTIACAWTVEVDMYNYNNYYFNYYNAFYPANLTNIYIGRNLVIKDEANKYIDEVTHFYKNSIDTLSIGKYVTEFPRASEFRDSCKNISTIHYNATNLITTGLFEGFTSLKNLTIGDSVTVIPEAMFSNCTELTDVTIPNSVTTIGSSAFYNCNSLTPTTISATEIGDDAFYGCNKFINSQRIKTTQTSAIIHTLSSPTEHIPYISLYNSYYKARDKISGLQPGTKHNYNCGLIINDNYCRILENYFYTSAFNVYLNGTASVTSLSANGSYSEGDATLVGEGINLDKKVTNFDNNNDSIFEYLDPNTTYTVYYGVKIKENSSAYTTSKTFTTGALEWSAGEYQATSTTSVRLMTETTCDATAGTGIEWRRYGAPESLAPNKAECPVVDGMLVGYLKGLNPEAYYEYRPYYTSASGKTYYGEWAAFFSGDAGVYFEPEVRTFTENSVDGNSVTIKGYALPGTDEVTGQGFEYWKASGISTFSTDNVKTVSASGISMSVTLSNLDYNSTYCYRAFVTTAKGTTYGDTVEFSTGYPAGIYTVEADSDESTASFRIMPGMLVVNGEGDTPVMVADMNGRVLFSGYAAGQLELPLNAGIYILRLGNDAHKVAIR